MFRSIMPKLKFHHIPKLQYLMLRRILTNLVCLFGLLSMTSLNAQQVTLSLSPNQVTPTVGQTVNFDVVVTNFTNVNSLQLGIDWDATLFEFVAVTNVNIPSAGNFGSNPVGGNSVFISWNAAGAANTTLPNGQAIFRLQLKAILASTNYWVRFQTEGIEVTQNSSTTSPAFGNVGNPPGNANLPVGVRTTSVSVQTNKKVCVGVLADNFTNLTTARWTHKWDKAVLRFDSVSTFNAAIGFTTANFATNLDSVRLSWTNASAKTVTNSDTLYKVCFTSIGATGTSSLVQTLPTTAEVVRSGNTAIALAPTNGTVSIVAAPPPPTGGLTFAGTQETGNVGDTVCMRIYAKNFKEIASIQWSMHWDSLKMSLIRASIQNASVGTDVLTIPTPAPNPTYFSTNLIFTYKPAETGTLRFFADLSGSPSGSITFNADSTLIFDVCLKINAGAGTTSPFTFNGTPLKIFILDKEPKSIPAVFVSGSIVINNGALPPVDATNSITNVSCNAGTNGAITLTPSGGSGNYTYNWTGPSPFAATTKDISNLKAGTYNVTISSSSATAKTLTLNVTEPVVLSSTKNSTNVNCFGQSTAGASVTPAGGTSPYTYLWSSGETTSSISIKPAGNYSVTITDAKLCTLTETFTLTQPTAALSTSNTVTSVKCNGGTDGAVNLTVTGGTAPYTYSWTGPSLFTASTEDLADIKAGTYNVTVTDAKLCTLTETVTLTQPTAALNTSNTVTNAKCNGGTDGAVNLTVTGGTAPYTYSWTGPSPFTASTEDLADVKAGTYNVTVTDSKQCAQTGSAIVGEPVSMSVTPSVTSASCGTNNGAINITVAGGTAPYTYKWTGPSYNSTNQNITGLATGTYIVEITDNTNCKFTSTGIAVSNTNPSFSVTNTPVNIKCNGGTDGAISLTVTGGSGVFTYTWTGPTSFAATTKDISALKAGSYSVTVRETSTGCEIVQSGIAITEPTVIAIGTPQVVNVKCKGDKTGSISISVTGGTGDYTYTWDGPNGFTAFNTSAVSLLGAGTYNVTVKDANLCEKITSVTVTEPAGNALSIGNPSVTNIKCNGGNDGAIVTTVSGGTAPYSYTWTGPSFSSSAQNPSGLLAGTYKFTVTDANGCTAISNDIIVNQPSAISIAEVVKNTEGACNGEINITVTGGTAPYTYAWTGAGTNATSEDQTGLCPNITYNVKVTDANGCIVNKAISVTGTIAPPIRLTDSVVVSQAGCPGQASGGIDIVFTGGKASFSFEWLNATGQVISRVQNPRNLTAGKYRVRISDAVGQIYLSGEIEVKQSESTIVITTANITKESCAGSDGSIDINVTGGTGVYTYTWNHGPTSQDVFNLKEGKYSVSVNDNNGCFTDKKDMMVEKTLCPLTSTTTKKDPTCSSGTNDKGSITVNITNGEPGYIIKWGTGANQEVRVNNAPSKAASYEITGLSAGTYTISITDAKGQVTTLTETLTAANDIIITKTVTNDSGNCKGSIILAVSGGTPQYSYVWNDGATSRDRFDLCANKILSVVVTDSRGCFKSTSNDTIRLSVTTLAISNSANITNATCPDDELTGKIDITVTGGVKPYTFKWSNPTGSTDEDLTRVKPGTYTVTVTDNVGTRVTQTFVLGTTSTLAIKDLIASSGSATVTFEGGEAPYTVAWCTGSPITTSNTTASQANLGTGACGVTITDNKGCKVSRRFDVTAACAVVKPEEVYPGFNLKCSTDKNGRATVTSITDQSLVAPFQYRWDSGETGNSAAILVAGNRTVTITGNNNKTCIASFTMKAPEPIKVNVVSISDNCSLQATVTGGIAPYKYRWSTPKGDVTPTIKDLTHTVSYFVLVTDTLGCSTDPVSREAVCPTFCLKGREVITPNEDGKNDFFKIEKCDFTNVKLQIFNRWGQLVYESNDYTDQWEGYTQDNKAGKQLPEGVYMYILRGKEANGKELETKATVSIIRQ
jgi:gliding motility-associated-like protein